MHHSFASLYGADQGEQCLCYAAFVLWHLGYPDQALKRLREAFTLAQEFSHPYNLVYVLICAALLHQLCREGQAAEERAEAVIALSNEQGFPLYLALGTIVRGWALTKQSQVEEGIAQIQQGLAAWRATGAELFRPHGLVLLAEAYGKTEQTEAGITALAEALAIVNKTGERMWEAELYRLKGELVLQSGVRGPESEEKNQKSKGKGQKSKVTEPRPLTPDSQGEAEACFLKAIEIARKQQAKSLELRAVMSLVRLRQQQASEEGSRNTQHDSRIRLAEDHQMLSEVYHWFTEGFDTKDLQEAKALLESLESSV
jgi:predicted ATPase